MKYFTLIFCTLLLISCSKEKNEDMPATNPLLNGKWHRVSMELNPEVILPKQDGCGEFHTIRNLMELKDLEGYERNYEGYYTFNNNGHYLFTPIEESEKGFEGTYEISEGAIEAITSKGEKVKYNILELNDEHLTLETYLNFLAQPTMVKILCNRIN